MKVLVVCQFSRDPVTGNYSRRAFALLGEPDAGLGFESITLASAHTDITLKELMRIHIGDILEGKRPPMHPVATLVGLDELDLLRSSAGKVHLIARRKDVSVVPLGAAAYQGPSSLFDSLWAEHFQVGGLLTLEEGRDFSVKLTDAREPVIEGLQLLRCYAEIVAARGAAMQANSGGAVVPMGAAGGGGGSTGGGASASSAGLSRPPSGSSAKVGSNSQVTSASGSVAVAVASAAAVGAASAGRAPSILAPAATSAAAAAAAAAASLAPALGSASAASAAAGFSPGRAQQAAKAAAHFASTASASVNHGTSGGAGSMPGGFAAGGRGSAPASKRPRVIEGGASASTSSAGSASSSAAPITRPSFRPVPSLLLRQALDQAAQVSQLQEQVKAEKGAANHCRDVLSSLLKQSELMQSSLEAHTRMLKQALESLQSPQSPCHASSSEGAAAADG